MTRWTALALVIVLAGCGGDEPTAPVRFGDKGVVEWIGLLGSEEADVREQAVERLAAGGVDAVPVLTAILAVGTGDTRQTLEHLRAAEMAEMALVRVGAPAVPALVDALGSDNEWARIHAAGALGSIHPAPVAAVAALTANLSHVDSTVRTTSARALGEIGPGAVSASTALTTALRDENPNVREAAATALARTGVQGARDATRDELVARLSDEAEDVRAAAVQTLTVLGPRPDALPRLLEMLEEDDLASMYVPAALEALGKNAAPALPRLIEALDHAAWGRRSGAARVLGALGPLGAPAVDRLLGLLDDHVLQVRWAAAEALGSIGVAREDVRARLRTLAAEDEEASVRDAAQASLRQLGD